MKSYFIAFLLFTCTSLQAQVQTVKTVSSLPAVKKSAFLVNASYAGGVPVPHNANFKVSFTRAVFDETNNFSITNGEFVAPSEGIYHFDIRVNWMQFTAPGLVTINVNRAVLASWASSILIPSTTHRLFDTNYSLLLKIPAGEKVMIYLKQDSGAPQKFQQVQLSGYKVD
jgi:hypothetical protein